MVMRYFKVITVLVIYDHICNHGGGEGGGGGGRFRSPERNYCFLSFRVRYAAQGHFGSVAQSPSQHH